MRVLIVTPLYHRQPRSLTSVLALDAPCAVDYLMLGNDDPHTDGSNMGNFRNITHKYRHAQDVFLSGDYDYMLCAEDDIIIPPDAIHRLLACDADIAYGLICWRHGGQAPWSARVADQGQELGRVLSETPDAARAAWGKVIDVVGVGQACTLIKRSVLETLHFRLVEERPVCCDWWLAVDALAQGFTQRADLGLMCGHISLTPSPRVLWPDATEARLWHVERL